MQDPAEIEDERSLQDREAGETNAVGGSDVGMGRDITYEDVAQSVVDLLLRAETRLPDDVTAALKDAHGRETDPTARAQIEAILENIELAAMRKVPIRSAGTARLILTSKMRYGTVLKKQPRSCRSDQTRCIRPGGSRPETLESDFLTLFSISMRETA